MLLLVSENNSFFLFSDTLCELFLSDLLPPYRKLKTFNQQPLSKLEELSSGNTVTRNKYLTLWYFEDQLKSVYNDFISMLTKLAFDTVEANKQKVITTMYKLLEGNPEMENVC